MSEQTSMSGSISSLFGWSNLKQQLPPKQEKPASINEIFHKMNQQKQEIMLCVDCSGSVMFNTSFSHDGNSFDKIYVEAMLNLKNQLPKHQLVCWSSLAKILTEEEQTIYNNAVTNGIPFANLISGMNAGTEPQHILPLIKGKISIIVTDGEIDDRRINMIRMELSRPDTQIGSVFLVIIPHIDSYKNMYTANAEASAMDSIRLSIPQAFSGRLATVIVWNYKNRKFEMVPSLTAPYIDQTKTLNELLSNPLPIPTANEFMVLIDGQYKSFSFDKLVEFLETNVIGEQTIKDLVTYGVAKTIRQQGSNIHKERWNRLIESMFYKMLLQKVNQEFVEEKIPDDATIITRIQITAANEKNRKKAENKYKNELEKLCADLLIDKLVGEISNISQAKASQTIANVNNFKQMKQEDKLAEIASVLVKEDCSICGINTNVYKAVSIPTKLTLNMTLSKDERNIPAKKGRMRTVATLNVNNMKDALEQYPPRLHCMCFCSDCANITLKTARLPSDPEYGITNIIPQNITTDMYGNQAINERIMLFPLIDKTQMSEYINPNDSKLSYSRQWMRGFVSKVIGLDPAGPDIMMALLMFLCALPTDKPSAEMIFANVMSLCRGGRNDNYKNTIGRLFHENFNKISAEVLTQISIVERVVDLAEMPVRPESNKLLLLCLLNRKIASLVYAKNQRITASNKLDTVINDIITNKPNNEGAEKFGITDAIMNDIKNMGLTSVNEYKTNYADDYNRFLGIYLQNVMNLDFNHIAMCEQNLIKLLGAKTTDDMVQPMNMNKDYLNKMIEKSNMSVEQFIQMVPNYINAFVNSNGNINILQQFI